MEYPGRKEFQNSLDLTSEELEKHVPELLRGLWELGSMPPYIIDLFGRNNLGHNLNILDLGCGKGAVLVKLATQFDIKAIGVDLIPEFIEDANTYAIQYGVSDKISFKTEDIPDTINTTAMQDIVIYGYDSEILGDLKNTLTALSRCVIEGGYIILEYMVSHQPEEGFLTEEEMTKTIEWLGFEIVDSIFWDKDLLKGTNRYNTEIIKGNAERLSQEFPDKIDLFNEYVQNQINECEELENDYICMTLLIRP